MDGEGVVDATKLDAASNDAFHDELEDAKLEGEDAEGAEDPPPSVEKRASDIAEDELDNAEVEAVGKKIEEKPTAAQELARLQAALEEARQQRDEYMAKLDQVRKLCTATPSWDSLFKKRVSAKETAAEMGSKDSDGCDNAHTSKPDPEEKNMPDGEVSGEAVDEMASAPPKSSVHDETHVKEGELVSSREHVPGTQGATTEEAGEGEGSPTIDQAGAKHADELNISFDSTKDGSALGSDLDITNMDDSQVDAQNVDKKRADSKSRAKQDADQVDVSTESVQDRADVGGSGVDVQNVDTRIADSESPVNQNTDQVDVSKESVHDRADVGKSKVDAQDVDSEGLVKQNADQVDVSRESVQGHAGVGEQLDATSAVIDADTRTHSNSPQEDPGKTTKHDDDGNDNAFTGECRAGWALEAEATTWQAPKERTAHWFYTSTRRPVKETSGCDIQTTAHGVAMTHPLSLQRRLENVSIADFKEIEGTYSEARAFLDELSDYGHSGEKRSHASPKSASDALNPVLGRAFGSVLRRIEGPSASPEKAEDVAVKEIDDPVGEETARVTADSRRIPNVSAVTAAQKDLQEQAELATATAWKRSARLASRPVRPLTAWQSPPALPQAAAASQSASAPTTPEKEEMPQSTPELPTSVSRIADVDASLQGVTTLPMFTRPAPELPVGDLSDRFASLFRRMENDLTQMRARGTQRRS